MDRRKFVQYCVGAAAVGSLTAGTLGMAKPLAILRPGGSVEVKYFGAQRSAGPAPRGLPLIPMFLNARGEFEGRTFIATGGTHTDEETGEEKPNGMNILDWYKYCGHAGAPGLTQAYPADQNPLKYFISEEKAAVIKPWYMDLLEKPMRPEDFPDDEFGAGGKWRSDGQEGPNVLTASVVRYKSKVIKHLEAKGDVINPGKPLSREEYQMVREQFYVDHEGSTYVAFSTFCTHFCCIPGYKEAEKLARPRNAWDKVFCTCHNSVYDPREPVAYSFFPDPADESGGDDGGGGGH